MVLRQVEMLKIDLSPITGIQRIVLISISDVLKKKIKPKVSLQLRNIAQRI